MKLIVLALSALVFALAPTYASDASAARKVIYNNPGDNTEGFVLKYGDRNFTVDHGCLVAGQGGGWCALPVVLHGDFQLDFDVYGDSNDVDSDIIFADDQNGEGIEVNDCPQDTDTPTLSIRWSTHLCDHEGFYFDLTTLVSAPATKFPKSSWTHIRITKRGNTLIDDVGGQVISTDVSESKFPAAARLGLGYYSTQNLGGAGLIRYAHIHVVQLSPDDANSIPSSNVEPSPTVDTNRSGMD